MIRPMCCGLDMRPEMTRDVWRCSTCDRELTSLDWISFLGKMRWNVTRFLFWAGFLWAAPVTLAGILFALVTGCRFVAWREGAAFFNASEWLTRNFFERFGMLAFTWAGVCVWRHDALPSPRAIAHELVHFKQARIFGPFMPLVYAGCSLVAWAQGGHAYSDNALEKWARNEAGR